jgi:hypothetical protein
MSVDINTNTDLETLTNLLPSDVETLKGKGKIDTTSTPYPFVVIDKFTSALWSGHESEPLAMKQFTTGFSYLIEVV